MPHMHSISLITRLVAALLRPRPHCHPPPPPLHTHTHTHALGATQRQVWTCEVWDPVRASPTPCSARVPARGRLSVHRQTSSCLSHTEPRQRQKSARAIREKLAAARLLAPGAAADASKVWKSRAWTRSRAPRATSPPSWTKRCARCLGTLATEAGTKQQQQKQQQVWEQQQQQTPQQQHQHQQQKHQEQQEQ